MSTRRITHLSIFIILALAMMPISVKARLVNFTALGSFEIPVLNEGGITVTGSNNISVWELNGLGIVGGVSDNFLDVNEFIDFSFDVGAVTDVTYFLVITSNTDDGALTATHSIEAFGIGGAALGKKIVESGGRHSVSSLYGNQPMSRFRITMLSDSTRVGSVEYALPGCKVDKDGIERCRNVSLVFSETSHARRR